jgi:hypothetical protein
MGSDPRIPLLQWAVFCFNANPNITTDVETEGDRVTFIKSVAAFFVGDPPPPSQKKEEKYK